MKARQEILRVCPGDSRRAKLDGIQPFCCDEFVSASAAAPNRVRPFINSPTVLALDCDSRCLLRIGSEGTAPVLISLRGIHAVHPGFRWTGCCLVLRTGGRGKFFDPWAANFPVSKRQAPRLSRLRGPDLCRSVWVCHPDSGLHPDSPDEMAFGQLCAPISAVKSNSYAGSSSRIPTDPTGERRNWQFRQRFRGLRSCRPNPSEESGLRSCRFTHEYGGATRMGDIVFTARLNAADWDSEKQAWRCPALDIPGATIREVFVSGERADKPWYEVLSGPAMVRWVLPNPPPQIAVVISLSEALSLSSETGWWKRIRGHCSYSC